MLPLIPDILQHPRKVLPAEAHNIVTTLPVQELSFELLVGLVRRSSLQLLNEIADGDVRFNAKHQMDMIISAADFMKVDPFGLLAAILDVSMNPLFSVSL